MKSILGTALAVLITLTGCSHETPQGYGPRSTMLDEEASADRLEQISELIADSDTDGLVAEFSDAAKGESDGLSGRIATLMSVIGGGTLTDGDLYVRVGTLRSGEMWVVSSATITAADGTRWQAHVTDCTLNRDDPSQLGIRGIEVIPYSDHEAPQGFCWHDENGQWPPGIRFIRSWNGWDPYTSPNSQDW